MTEIKLIATKNLLERNEFLRDCIDDTGYEVYPFNDKKFDELLKEANEGHIKDKHINTLIKKLDLIRQGENIGRNDSKVKNRLETMCDVDELPNSFHVVIGNDGRMFYSLIFNKEKYKVLVGDDCQDVKKH